MSCLVKVDQGILQGKECKTYDGKKYYSFQGIPYAKPPVGDLRFKAPQEIDNWSGIKDATKPGNKCAQLNMAKGVFEGSEDCLYLNIHTPVLPVEETKKLPVIFFIHGGRLVIGYGDYYQPDYFLQRDVILVTINYRLNVFGFLCLDTPEVPGNAGLKDTIVALRWVKRNIKYFNGDDNNITVSGESAGAGIVASFLTSKMADGLFDKMICQSGTSLSDLYIVEEDVIDRASKITEYLGKTTRNINELHHIFLTTSAEDLVSAFTSADLNRHPSVVHAFLLPVVEKKFNNIERFFEEPPIVVLKENRFKKVPIIVSSNSHEAVPFLRKNEHGNIYYEQDLQYFIPRYLFINHGTEKAMKFANAIRKFYFGNKNIDELVKNEYIHLMNDHIFNRDIVLFLELLAKYQNNIFSCRFGYAGSMNTRLMKNLGLKGASHGDLVQYFFYRESKAKLANENDLKIVQILVDAWCNFAKTGNPSSKDLLWQPYDQKRRLCLNIEEDIRVEPLPHFERIKFWFDLIKERSKL